MPAEEPCPDNHPLMLAWKAYQATEEYKNTRKWALKPLDYFDDSDIPAPQNDGNKFSKEMMLRAIEGSLWACFMMGFIAGVEKAP